MSEIKQQAIDEIIREINSTGLSTGDALGKAYDAGHDTGWENELEDAQAETADSRISFDQWVAETDFRHLQYNEEKLKGLAEKNLSKK